MSIYRNVWDPGSYYRINTVATSCNNVATTPPRYNPPLQPAPLLQCCYNRCSIVELAMYSLLPKGAPATWFPAKEPKAAAALT